MQTHEWELYVPVDAMPRRLDQFLSDKIKHEGFSREKIKKAIRQGSCTIDGEVALCGDIKIASGQTIFFQMESPDTSIQAEQGELEILYQDQYLAIVNKPAGMTTHPAASCLEGTLAHRLLAHFPQLHDQEGFRPGIVHRLDKNTSGLLCVALTEESRLRLTELIANRSITKEYLALVHGRPAQRGEIKEPIGRDPSSRIKMAILRNGKTAWTEWEVLYQGDSYALLAIRIHTGRTHQIRVHMSHLGYPLLGDAVYGSKRKDENLIGTQRRVPHAEILKRQMLHAWKLSFLHPFTHQPLSFLCQPPMDFFQVGRHIEKKMQQIVITGSAGSGKSSLTRAFADLGIPTWSADAAMIQLYEPGRDGWIVLRQRYGERFIHDIKSPVDRKQLANALLPNGDALPEVDVRELNALLHPLLDKALDIFWHEQEGMGHTLAVAEVPLWHESGMTKASIAKKKEVPFLICVTCDEEERRRRLLHVRGWSEAFLLQAERMQWTQIQKAEACSYRVENTGTFEDLQRKAKDVIEFFKEGESVKETYFFQQWERLFRSATPCYMQQDKKFRFSLG